MKKQIYLALGAIVALAILLWWFWPRPSASPVAAQPRKSVASPTATATSSASSRAPAKDDITAEDLARIPGPGTGEQKRARILELREIMNQANQPVGFWGQVIDQDNAPLPGVKVKLSLKHTRELLPGSTRDVFDYLDLVTDAQGMFSVAGRKGSLLGIEELKKEGYEAPYVGNRAYWYAPPIVTMQFTPNETKPEIFRMWKLVGAERLVQKGIGAGIPYDGRSVNFDLQRGVEVQSGGDIRVTLTRTPLQIKRGQQKYDWIATIEALDGGLIETLDEFMYHAPEIGYVSKLTLTARADAPDWSYQRKVAFYLKSRGNYARVKAEFMTDSERPTTGFSVEAFVNPSGSRNLEYDPLQNVAKPTTSKP